MRVRFVRIAGEHDRIYVTRDNGTEVSWSFPSYGNAVPHDLVHLVVETHFQLRRGFWGRVADGVDPKRVNEEANRHGGAVASKYAGFGSDLRELLLAEALAAVVWIIDENQLRNARELAAGLGIELTDEALDEVRGQLVELNAKWRTLVPKGTLEMTFIAS